MTATRIPRLATAPKCRGAPWWPDAGAEKRGERSGRARQLLPSIAPEWAFNRRGQGEVGLPAGPPDGKRRAADGTSSAASRKPAKGMKKEKRQGWRVRLHLDGKRIKATYRA